MGAVRIECGGMCRMQGSGGELSLQLLRVGEVVMLDTVFRLRFASCAEARSQKTTCAKTQRPQKYRSSVLLACEWRKVMQSLQRIVGLALKT